MGAVLSYQAYHFWGLFGLELNFKNILRLPIGSIWKIDRGSADKISTGCFSIHRTVLIKSFSCFYSVFVLIYLQIVLKHVASMTATKITIFSDSCSVFY